MTLINLNLPSQHSPDITINDLVLQQIKLIHISSQIIEIFKYDKVFINDIIAKNIHIIETIENKPTIEDIMDTILNIRKAFDTVTKHLRLVQRNTKTATPKNIFLNKLHNTYGIFLLEMNSLVSNTELQLRVSKLSTKTLENLFNSPYTKPHGPISENSNNSPPSCCCLRTKKKLTDVTPT